MTITAPAAPATPHRVDPDPSFVLSVELDAPADRVFDAVCTPVAFRHVTRRLVALPVLRRRREPWQEGETVSGLLLLFGVLPVSRHHLRVAELDPDRRLLRSDEHGGLVRRWQHDIVVDELPGGRCRYTDRLVIDAGALTPVVVAWARWFYRVRQRRWSELATALRPQPAAGPT